MSSLRPTREQIDAAEKRTDCWKWDVLEPGKMLQQLGYGYRGAVRSRRGLEYDTSMQNVSRERTLFIPSYEVQKFLTRDWSFDLEQGR